MTIEVLFGDMLEILPTLEENSFDSVVTDPPYHLTSIVKRFSKGEPEHTKTYKDMEERSTPIARLARGFMGKSWDGGDIAFQVNTWEQILRVLKPGGYLLCFGGTRTSHRMACAIEDAGFEIRDTLMWLYGTGFPKSLNISKQIDKKQGAEREILGIAGKSKKGGGNICTTGMSGGEFYITASATDLARKWDGWGTALKPSFEPLVIARKPFNNKQYWNIIGYTISELWSKLWLMLPASVAEQFSGLNPNDYGVDPRAFVRWSADDVSNTRADLFARMDTLQFESALVSSLSTASLWSGIFAAASGHESTSTTEMDLNQTTDLKTLSCCLSKITPESIIRAHRSGYWSSADASPAERYSNAAALKWRGILELSAAEIALSSAHIFCQAETGWIRPAYEPIIMARKPIEEKTVADQVLSTGTGAINIDACRITTTDDLGTQQASRGNNRIFGKLDYNKGDTWHQHIDGRWPANVIHDGSADVLEEFKKYGDGNAARFFYSAKANKNDRNGSKHPTVKPVSLMQYLVRLVTPLEGKVLDPFAGSGTTGVACKEEGFHCTMIEKEEEYVYDIYKRFEENNLNCT